MQNKHQELKTMFGAIKESEIPHDLNLYFKKINGIKDKEITELEIKEINDAFDDLRKNNLYMYLVITGLINQIDIFEFFWGKKFSPHNWKLLAQCQSIYPDLVQSPLKEKIPLLVPKDVKSNWFEYTRSLPHVERFYHLEEEYDELVNAQYDAQALAYKRGFDKLVALLIIDKEAAGFDRKDATEFANNLVPPTDDPEHDYKALLGLIKKDYKNNVPIKVRVQRIDDEVNQEISTIDAHFDPLINMVDEHLEGARHEAVAEVNKDIEELIDILEKANVTPANEVQDQVQATEPSKDNRNSLRKSQIEENIVALQSYRGRARTVTNRLELQSIVQDLKNDALKKVEPIIQQDKSLAEDTKDKFDTIKRNTYRRSVFIEQKADRPRLSGLFEHQATTAKGMKDQLHTEKNTLTQRYKQELKNPKLQSIFNQPQQEPLPNPVAEQPQQPNNELIACLRDLKAYLKRHSTMLSTVPDLDSLITQIDEQRLSLQDGNANAESINALIVKLQASEIALIPAITAKICKIQSVAENAQSISLK